MTLNVIHHCQQVEYEKDFTMTAAEVLALVDSSCVYMEFQYIFDPSILYRIMDISFVSGYVE